MSETLKPEPAIENTSLNPHPEWILGGNPQAIVEQEKEGQRQLACGGALPVNGTEGKESEWAAVGVTLGGTIAGDPLFRWATFPAGWKIVPTAHHMWSHLVDANGEARARIFYKAAFYDRDATVFFP